MILGVQLGTFERLLVRAVAQHGARAARLPQSASSSITPSTSAATLAIRPSGVSTQLNRLNASLEKFATTSSIVDGLQNGLNAIRSQIEIIRTKGAADVGGTLTAGQRAENQAAIDEAITEIDRIATSKIDGRRLLNAPVQFTQKTEITGINPQKIEQITLSSIPTNSTRTLSGNVVSAASAAELVLEGDTGNVISTATFTLTGSGGSQQFSITRGESLQDVRDRVNDQTLSTGVEAAVDGDSLVLRSVSKGAAQSLSIEADSVDDYLNISGVNANQVTNFQATNIVSGTSQTISGTVDTREAQGVVLYTGSGGVVTASSRVRVSGNLGNKTYNISNNETLTSVRDRINADTSTTGVKAAVSGNQLFFQSANAGSTQFVKVERVSGAAFAVTGGDATGTDYGLDDTATINGQAVTGNGGQFTYSDETGDYSFNVANGFSGAFDPIQVEYIAGIFNVTGGNGDGTAQGADGEVVINGQSVFSDDQSFTYSNAGLQVTLQITEGFTGNFDDVMIAQTTNLQRARKTAVGGLIDESGRPIPALSISGVGANALGDASGFVQDLFSGGALAGLGSRATDAVNIADKALSLVDQQLGMLADFEKETLAETTAALSRAKINLQSQLAAPQGSQATATAAATQLQENLLTPVSNRDSLFELLGVGARPEVSSHRERIFSLLHAS